MKPGRVVYMRINPKDCMSIVDALDKLYPREVSKEMSFEIATRIVLSAFLEGARSDRIIPDRDGFEYNEVMGRFPGVNTAPKVKMNFANALDKAQMLQPEVDDPRTHVTEQDKNKIERMKREADYRDLKELLEQNPERFNELYDRLDTMRRRWEGYVVEFGATPIVRNLDTTPTPTPAPATGPTAG